MRADRNAADKWRWEVGRERGRKEGEGEETEKRLPQERKPWAAWGEVSPPEKGCVSVKTPVVMGGAARTGLWSVLGAEIMGQAQ